MAKQLNVNLAFTADTSQAKAQLQNLQQQLNNILKMPSNKLNLADDIKEAIEATAELSSRLQQATNVNTGNLDFSKFNNSLKQSGQSLQSYGQQLQRLGPTGQQAFLTLTKSIAAAEIPIKRTNTLVKEFATSLANTARWQISSSVLHGFMGAMQSAYGYAQDLNESLNNIRIVTGQSVEQMANFAVEANRAARALSTTTTEYTKASLIYYQQGLSDQQVKERADVTIKMANVSKQSAQTVSEQMTAIWNNFYDGSKALEYYADVMTALGAKTASSTDEIAGGLEKFAAIGETIGLSYEYAASALTTITSNTRQSEEVVGTALKTIFARIQGLNLGETLDDGTTINKYSEALKKVGISIFNSSGELKKMDDILDEMGAKWDNLSKAQQAALAQTVAGTRQYTQLVALMENWNKNDSDSMKTNLATAYGSSGATQQQANIYAESWEAASDRVRGAAEKIYDALLNDEFFIDTLNGFEKILIVVDDLISNLGGLKGVFFTLGAVVTKIFSAQISQGLTNMAYNVKMALPGGPEAIEQERRQFIAGAIKNIPQSNEYTTEVEEAQKDSLRSELTLQSEYMANAEKMSDIETETNKKLIDRVRLLKEQVVQLRKQEEITKSNISDKVMLLRGSIQIENENNPTGNQIDYKEEVVPLIDDIKAASEINAILQDAENIAQALGRAGDEGSKAFRQFKADLASVELTEDVETAISDLINDINMMGDSEDPLVLKEKIEALNLELEKLFLKNTRKIKTYVPKNIRNDVDNLTESFKNQAIEKRKLDRTIKDGESAYEAAEDSINGAKGAQKQWSDIMVESANVAFNVASAISMVSSAIDTLKDPNVSGMQKFITVLSTLGMGISTVTNLIGSMKKLFSEETVIKIANAAATWGQVAAEKAHNKVQKENDKTTRKTIKETWEDTKQKIANKKQSRRQVWNEAALEKDKRFSKLDDGTYHRQGDPETKVYTKDAAASESGAAALQALGSKMASIGIAVAGILILVGGIVWVVNQLNKAEKVVEKAQAAAQQLSENYDNVKTSYDNFINTSSNYETITKSMEEMTKGTIEYQEALMQANEAAGELLATNKNLKYDVKDGQIVIDEQSLADARAAELNAVENAYVAKIAGQRELSEADIELKKRDAARDMKSGSDNWQKAGNSGIASVIGSIGAGAAAGGIVGAVGGSGVFSVPAAIIGAAVGGTIGLVAGIVQETSTKTEQAAFDALAKKAEEDEDFLARLKAGEVKESEFIKIGIEDKNLIASLQQNGEQIGKLIDEMAENTAAVNAQNDLVASNVLADNEAVQNSDYQNQIIDITGDAYGLAYDKAMESDWVDKWGKKGLNKAHKTGGTAKDVFEEYLEYAGLKDKGYRLKNTTGTDKNRQFIYTDREGNEHTVSLQAMQAARAAYEASNTLDEAANKLAETFDKLAQSGDKADKAFLSILSEKNFESATETELNRLWETAGGAWRDTNGEPTIDGLNLMVQYMQSALGVDGLTKDMAIQYGYESVDEWVRSTIEKMDSAKEAWDSITIPEEFKFAEGMVLGTAQALENQITQMNLGPVAEKAGEEYVSALNSLLTDIELDDQQEVLKGLTEIDWSNWDAFEQAEQVLESFNEEIDPAQWQEFIDLMRKANGAIPDFSSMKHDLQQVSKILNDLDFGSIITDDEYTTLVDWNNEWKKFFMLQSDGSRKFIGDQVLMKKALEERITAQQQDLNLRKENVENAKQNLKPFNWQITAKSIDAKYGGDGKDGKFSQKTIDKYNKQNDTHYKDSDDMVNNLMADETEQLLQNETISKILMENDYTQESIDTILEEAREGNRERLDTMLEFIDSYMNQNLEQEQKDIQEMYASIATSYAELDQLFDKGVIGEDKLGTNDETTAYEKGVRSLLASTSAQAQSLSELQNTWNQALSTGVGLDYSIYADGLTRLAENYSICADEVNNFTLAISSGNEAVIKSAQENLEASIMLGEAANKYGIEEKELNLQAQQFAKTYGLEAKAAAQLTIENERMNKGVSELVDNWSEWKKELKRNKKTSQDWAKAAVATTKAIADLVGASEDLVLPAEFFDSAENMALLDKAAKGSEKAINKLGLAVAAAQISMIEFQEGMSLKEKDSFIDEAQFNNWKEIIQQGILDLQNSLDNVGFGENVFEKLGGDEWVEALNQMAIATGMSVEQMNSMLNSMGVQAEVSTIKKQVTTNVPWYKTREKIYYEKGERYTVSHVVEQGLDPVPGEIEVAQINTGDSIGQKPKITYTGNSNVSRSAKKGSGSGSNSKKADTVKKSDVVKRYKEVDDSMEKLSDTLEDTNKAMDRLYGTSRLKQMEKQNDLIQDEIKLLKQKKKEALAYIDEDRKALAAAAKEVGVTLSLDENGLITNYTEAMTKVYNQLDAAITKANKDGNAAESEQKRIDTLQEKVDNLKSAIDQYDETRTLIDDLSNQMDDKFYEWQDNNAEMLSYKLELNLEINDMELETIEYELNKIADDFYKMAEAAALMIGGGAGAQSSQLSTYLQELKDYEQNLNDLDESYKKGEISQEAYVSGLKEARSGLMKNLQSLQELDKSMMEYYGNTLDMAAEEIAKYTDRMDHQVSVLDHYSSLLEIMGKSNDYKAMGQVLKGRSEVLKDQVAVAKETMEMYKSQANARLAKYQDALAQGDAAAAELYLQQYEAALSAANEAEDVYLSKAEEWAEALKAVLENKLADLADILENALTGGTSFDSIATSMERASSLQEEYLTTTNKIYETNKMINTAQKEIDKTTNTVAKQRLKNFQQETSQLQNKSKLSQYELDIQQAKYDLLLAEIALEETQQAKSTVRLRRDSEGNFGYVYTADANAIADAEQRVADAQNTLYNKGLEGANSYVQKYQETMSEMYDTLKEIQEQYLNGEFATEEEYHRKMEEAKAYYYQKLQDYSSLYQVALTTDSRVVADAWSTDFADMVYSTKDWQMAVNDYVDQVKVAFDDWHTQIQTIAADTSLDILEENIKGIVDESEKLKDAIMGDDGVINAIEQEIDAVAEITSGYATLRKTLSALMDDYEALGKTIDKAVRKQQAAELSTSSNNTTFNAQSIGGKSSNKNETNRGNNEPSTQPSKKPIGLEKPVEPQNPTIKVYPNVNDTGRGSSSIRASDISSGGRPVSGALGTVIEISYHGNSKYGYVLSADWNAYVKYKNEKKQYEKDLAAYNTAIASMDTGGYTGSWGSEGKLAMLHQKELVLNPEDTTNFLASLEVLREIINVIDLHSMNAQLAGLLSSPYYNNNTEAQVLEQQVHIEATFPNVSDRNEIEEAFNNLVNRASQFVNRK